MDGRAKISTTIVVSLVDTNILVYQFDARSPEKQRMARDLLDQGIIDHSLALAHQAVIEFYRVVTRSIPPLPALLNERDARRETDDLLFDFPILYPTANVIRTALRGRADYQLPWYDAHMWAYAEVFGLSELISEDFQHDRVYGSVRIVNPFV